MHRNIILLVLLLTGSIRAGMAASPSPAPTFQAPLQTLPPDHPNLKAWRDRSFGMFIHWGPASLKAAALSWSRAGERRDCKTTITKGIPAQEYDDLYKQFNPARFNADEWVAVAKAAGMKYIVLVAKHHDGFCMFDSGLTDYKITSSPFKRDVTAELARACHKAGLSFGVCYSPADWHHPDFFTKNHTRYIDYMRGQVHELLTKYGAIDEIWFDYDGGVNTPETWNTPALFKMIRELQPQSVATTRCGGGPVDGPWGDILTPLQSIGFNMDRAWEQSMTISTHNIWGWGGDADGVKPLAECIRTLAKCAGGDGNLLLDVGPQSDGMINAAQASRLRDMGDWLKVNGDAIFGTRGGPFRPTDDIVSTRKGNKVFLHVMQWEGDSVNVPVLPKRVLSARLLKKGRVAIATSENEISLAVPEADRDAFDTVIELTLDGPAMDITPRNISGGGLCGRGARLTASNVYRRNPEYGPDKAADGNSATRWATDAGTRAAWLEIDLGVPWTFNCVKIDEALGSKGEKHIRFFEFQVKEAEKWRTILSGSSIGAGFVSKPFPEVTARVARLSILDATGGAAISEINLLDTNLPGWRVRDTNKPNPWSMQGGLLVSSGTGAEIISTGTYSDFEFSCEYKIARRGRTAIYLRGRHALTLADDAGSSPGFATSGGIENFICPAENAALPSDRWQKLDVTFIGRTLSVALNGTNVIPNILVSHATSGGLDTNVDQPGPILLRGCSGGISFRNLRIKPLPQSPPIVEKQERFGGLPSDTLSALDEAERSACEALNPGTLPETPLRARLPFPSQKAFNWCSLNQDFFVHNQGPSSSCWAHTAIEALECNWLIRNGVRHPFSPQPVLDYTKWGDGGNSAVAFDVLLKHGTALLPVYTFAGQPGKVRANIPTPYRAIAWGRVGDGAQPGVTTVKTALLEHGPLAVDILVTDAFKKYRGGVFAEHAEPEKGGPSHNHEVLLLGWDDGRGKGAWYIKNSWGENWGERGYCWIEYGSDNVCHDAWWVRAQSTYYTFPQDVFLRAVPNADPLKVWAPPNGPIAEINGVRLEQPVIKNGANGIEFHVALQIRRAKGRTTTVAIDLLDNNGKFLPLLPTDHSTGANQAHLSVSADFTPPNDDCALNDVAIFLPYSKLSLKVGGNLFRYNVSVNCSNLSRPVNRPRQGTFSVLQKGP